MKHIAVTDEDYQTLMDLSKELQTQENDSQAFPYFWEPRSKKTTQGTDDDDHVIYDHNNSDRWDPKELAEDQPDFFKSFLESESEDRELSYDKYMDDNSFHSPERKWIDFVGEDPDYSIIYEKTEIQSEHNPSLFKSDVQEFCKHQTHHLGEKPGTYARTVWRMPRMKQLIEAIYRLNKQPKAFVNHEALRFVWNRDSNKNEFVDIVQVFERAGLRSSHQRIAIFQFLTSNPTASAKQVHKGLKEEIPTLSLTTVYNALKDFNKAGLSWRN